MNNGNKYTFWAYHADEVIAALDSSPRGLSTVKVEKIRRTVGSNSIQNSKRQSALLLFLGQFKNPITIILLFAAFLSLFLGDGLDAAIITVIVLFSAILGYWQERSAGNAVAQLLKLIQLNVSVIRDGQTCEISFEEVVPGDVVMLSAGDITPADCLILEEDNLFIDESAFTGETFPVEKSVGVLPADTVLSKRFNALFMGSHIVSGKATAIVVKTGADTEFGTISQALSKRAPITSFETDVRKFGFMLMQITLAMVVFLFGANVLLQKPILDSLLFTLAIAVGLTPQLLPAIITVNLSHGAKRMAQKRAIVKRLNSIENLGNMNILCADKTGTLTEGKVSVSKAVDCFGNESQEVLIMAKINSSFQQGFKNPIDEAIVHTAAELSDNYNRMGEIPYDFIRKRLTVLVNDGEGVKLITKGAVTAVLEVCTQAVDAHGEVKPIEEVLNSIHDLYEKISLQGFRTLSVAYKKSRLIASISKNDESDMIFAGFIILSDPLKTGIAKTLDDLRKYGVGLKIITGDNMLVAQSMARQIGMDRALLLTGKEIHEMSDSALVHQVRHADLFAEIEPNQKERIIMALKRSGNTVGFMGDGINDVSALHAADVGLSVNTAVDVAKEAADIVLLDQDLNVVVEGVKEGRKTFANTRKYIFMATSANFGNMFSMAGASMFLSYLPLLPKQVLLTNLMTDLPSMAISTDNVDEEWIEKPRRWDSRSIKRFMLCFGVLSSLFDYITFGVLIFLFRAGENEFRTGWFIESVVSATLIVLVIRTRKPFYRSKPSKYLLTATLAIAFFALLLPVMPFASLLGFVSVPLGFYAAMLLIVAMYIASAEMMKRWFNISDAQKA